MTQIFYHYVKGPVGNFLLAGTDMSLHFTGFTTGHQQREPMADWKKDSSALDYAIPQFEAYFSGQPVTFDVPITPKGTVFQKEVWSALQAVLFGTTASYGDIARLIGNPNASRAVGAANRANHLPLVIPCHRIIGSDGTMTGFGGGLDTKKKLLELEGVYLGPRQGSLFS